MTSIQEKIIKPKLWLLELAKQLGSFSQACNVMGYSRDTFTGSRNFTSRAVKKRRWISAHIPQVTR